MPPRGVRGADVPSGRRVQHDGSRGAWEHAAPAPGRDKGGALMNSLIYLVGLLVVLLAILTYLGVV